MWYISQKPTQFDFYVPQCKCYMLGGAIVCRQWLTCFIVFIVHTLWYTKLLLSLCLGYIVALTSSVLLRGCNYWYSCKVYKVHVMIKWLLFTACFSFRKPVQICVSIIPNKTRVKMFNQFYHIRKHFVYTYHING